MKKQLTLKKLSLFVLTALLFVLLSLAFAFTGTARAFADGEGQPCPDGQHSLGKVFVIEKQTCVSHGVGVRYCDKCGLSFNVVIPADGISHKVDKDGKCSECGTTNVHYVITENLPDNDYVEVGQVEESELQSITIPATVTTRGEKKDVHIAEGAFEGNETIQSVTILGTPEIGAEAFKDCKNLTNVTMEAGTQNIAADAFVGTPFYENKLEEAKNAENQDELQPISISINGGIGSYLLKVVDPTAIKAGSSGGSAEPEPEVRPRRNAATLAEEAEAPKTFTYTVAGGTQVIAEKAFEGLANLVEVTLNADLLTVGANAFDGCSGLKTIYIAENAAETSFANVAGLTPTPITAPFNTIYYRGGFAEKLFSQLANVIRYFSAAEPTDNAHTYWHFVEADGVELPTIWNKAVEIQLDTSKCTTRFRKGEPFSSENLVVKVRYENETQLKEVTENITINSTEYKADELGEYTITVSYLTYLKTTYTVKVDNAYTITINYGYDGMPSETELVFVSEGFTLPAAPSRTGYKFLGWKVGEEEELRGAGEKITPTADVTVTAQWEQLYRVTAQAANATTGLSETRYYQDGTTVTFTVTPDNGYKLVSVKNGDNTLTAQDGKYSVTVNKADIVITVETTAVTVTATAKEGTVAKEQNGDTATFTLTPPTKSGFRFDGWTVKIDNAEPVDVEGNTYTLKLANADVKVEFAAKWTEMLLTEASATLQLNGNTLTFIATVKGNGFDLETIKDVKLQLGAENPITGTAAAATDGFTLTYTLTGLTAKEYTLKFVLGTKDVYANKTISGTVTLTNTENTLRYALANGKLTVTEPLTVTFVVEHGTNLTRSVFAGDTLDLDEIEPAPVEGYVFLYWYTTDEEGTETKQSDEITVNSAMTINAKMGDEVTASVSIADYATAHGWQDSTKYTNLQLDKYILVKVEEGGGNSGKYYTNGTNWRIYQSENPNLTFTAANGAKIVTIKVTYTKDSHGILLNAEGEEYKSNAELEVNAPFYTFTIGNETEGGTGGKVFITAIEVTYGVVLTDAEKIQMAYDYLNANHGTIDTDYMQAVENAELPSGLYGTTFTWAVKDADTYKDYITIENNVLNITLPEEEQNVTIQVTISCGTAEAKTLEISVKISTPVNYGTEEAPLTVTEALAIAAKQCKEIGSWTQQVVYVKGYVLSTPTLTSYFGSFELGVNDSEEGEKILVYSANKNNGVNMIAQHDEVVLYGLITNHDGTIEFSRKQNEGASAYTEVLLHSRTIGQSTITLEANGATVNGVENNAKKTNDDTVSFTVQPAEGKKVHAVLVYGKQVNANSGSYSFTVAGDATIQIVQIDANATVAQVASLTFAKDGNGDPSIQNYSSQWTATRGERSYTIYGFNNNKNGWAFIKAGPNASTITTDSAFAQVITDVIVTIDKKDTNLSQVNGFKLEISKDSAFETIEETINLSLAIGENKFMISRPIENAFYRITIVGNGKDNKTATVSSVTYKGYTPTAPIEPEVKSFGISDLLSNGDGLPAIGLQVTTEGYDENTLKAATIVINGHSYSAGDGSVYNVNGNTIYRFWIGEAYACEAGTYDVKFVLDGKEYTNPTTGMSANTTVSYNKVKGVLAADGQKLTLTLTAEGSVEPEEKSITGIYGQALDQGKLLSFYAKVKGLNADTTTAENTFLVVGGTVRIPLDHDDNFDNNTKIHFYFDLSKISAVGSGTCAIEIDGVSYAMIVDSADGTDWTLASPTLDNYNVTFSTNGKGSAISMEITAKSVPEIDIEYSVTSITLANGSDATITVAINVSNDIEVRNATLTIGSKQIKIDDAKNQKSLVFTLSDIDEYLVDRAEISLVVNDTVAPKAWGTVSGSIFTEESSRKDYSLIKGDSTLTVHVVAYGTLAEPISVAEVLALSKDLGNNEWTDHEIYAKGKLTAAPETNQFTIVGDDEAKSSILVYKPTRESQIAEPVQNDIVTVYGMVENYGGTKLEFTGWTQQNIDFPAVVANERGTSTITVTNDGNATLEPQIPASAKNGQEITFKVTAPEGKKVSSVKVNNETVNADAQGDYKFTVAGDMTVVITVADASAPAEKTVELTVDSLGLNSTSYAANDSSHSVEGSDITFTTKNVMKQGDMQFKSSGSYLYNNESMGHIKSITVTVTSGSFTLYLGTSKNPSSNSKTSSYTAADADNYSYFKITTSTTTKISKIVIVYEAKDAGGEPEPGQTEKTVELTVDSLGLNSTSYAANDSSHSVEGSDITFTTKNVMKQGDMQFKSSGSYLYNNESMGHIKSITVTVTSGSFTLYLGTSKNPSSNSKTSSYTAADADNYSYFKITTSTTTKISKIVIVYEPASSDQGMEGPSMTAFTANMNNGNVESNGLWIALAVGGSALIALSALAVVVLLRKHN